MDFSKQIKIGGSDISTFLHGWGHTHGRYAASNIPYGSNTDFSTGDYAAMRNRTQSHYDFYTVGVPGAKGGSPTDLYWTPEMGASPGEPLDSAPDSP
jgi:hypothetical protein